MELHIDARSRRLACLQFAAMSALAAAAILELSPWRMFASGWLAKAFFLARMAALLGVATTFLRMRGLSWADVGLRRPRMLRAVLAVPLGLLGCAAASVLVWLGRGAMGPHAGPGLRHVTVSPLAHHPGEYAFWLASSWMVAALGEEMLFRGFLLDAARRTLGEGRAALLGAIVVQAVLFGLLHADQGAIAAVTAGATGAVLGLVWWGGGRNLWPGIVVHGLIDSAGMTALFLKLAPT